MGVEAFVKRDDVTLDVQCMCISGIVDFSCLFIDVCEYHQGRTVSVNLCKRIQYLQYSVNPSDFNNYKPKCDPSGNKILF